MNLDQELAQNKQAKITAERISLIKQATLNVQGYCKPTPKPVTDEDELNFNDWAF